MSMSSCGVSKPAGARPTRTADQIREALKSRCNSYLLTQWKERHHLLKGNSDQFHSALKAEMTSRLVDGMLPLSDDAPFVYRTEGGGRILPGRQADPSVRDTELRRKGADDSRFPSQSR